MQQQRAVARWAYKGLSTAFIFRSLPMLIICLSSQLEIFADSDRSVLLHVSSWMALARIRRRSTGEGCLRRENRRVSYHSCKWSDGYALSILGKLGLTTTPCTVSCECDLHASAHKGKSVYVSHAGALTMLAILWLATGSPSML